ncbi:MAG: Cna B-type domain-containing protein [[Eubacterium] sulci]|nr:Cna B-type domain-containing protein [[Eubacterium] sulci]
MQRRHAKRMTSLMLLIVFIAILIIGQSAKSTYAETATSSNIDIPVEVDWKGNYRVPVNVNLMADGELKQTITITYDTYWKSKFLNVPKYNSLGTEINYTITYEAADYGVKYKYSLSGNATNGFVIKIVPLRDIYVGKVWNVMPNIVIPGTPSPADPPTMTGMIATNLDSGTPAAAPEPLSEAPAVHAREATITEEIIEDYDPDSDALISAPVEVSSVPIPNAITVHLLADGVVVGTMQLTKDDDWEGRFIDYPRYDENDGHEIKYTTKEDPLAGYETSYFNGNIILNRSLIDVSVEKKWIGNSQSKAELTLHRACDYMKFDYTLNKHVRVKVDEEVATVELNAANNWKHTFSSLYEFYTPEGEDGVKYKYYVTEKSIPGYDTQITGNQDSGFVVTNKEINPKTPAPKTPAPKNPPQPKTPNTGDDSNFNLYALLLLSTAALIPAMAYRRKKI